MQQSDPPPLLAGLWERFRPLMQERLAVLDAAAAAQSGAWTGPVREAACDAAHKLAGSLGMFGFPEGTDVARELEQLLLGDPGPDQVIVGQLVTRLHAILQL